MNVAAGPELAAAVTNAGGLGVIGGVGYTPKILRQQVRRTFLSSRSGVSFDPFLPFVPAPSRLRLRRGSLKLLHAWTNQPS
jgi:hypothetical protein